MRETLAAALRGEGVPPGDDAPNAPPPQGNAAQGLDRITAIIEAIGELSHAERNSKPAAEEGGGAQKEGLAPGMVKYLEAFSKEKATVQVPREVVVGSEAHEKLKRRFERRYDEEEEPEGEKAKTGHDEL
jgi:hypothetical protein